jgi:F-type H+-transporting ATPase subunit gamma
MSDTLENLRTKINGAHEVASVVSAMKAVAASNISQYENAVAALSDYARTVDLGLAAYAGQKPQHRPTLPQQAAAEEVGIIVFGTDQGLVGRFNDELVEFVSTEFGAIAGKKTVWAVGEKMKERLTDGSYPVNGTFDLPGSVAAVTPLIINVLNTIEPQLQKWHRSGLYLVHNQPKAGDLYEPVSRRLLPLDALEQRNEAAMKWPTNKLPEVIGDIEPALIREYLFISIFRACVESLASENASRLAAMQRAEKNVNDLLSTLSLTYHRLRQGTIDEELFDVLSGFEALPVRK